MTEYVDIWRSTPINEANWSGVSYSPDVTFEEDGSSAHVHLAADIKTFNMSGGDKPVDSITTFGDKRITIVKPQEDFEIEMEVASKDTTFTQQVFGGTLSSGAIVSGTEYETAGSTEQKRWRIILTFEDGYADGERYRIIYKDCYAVGYEKGMNADEYWQGTITWKVSATDKDGNSNIIEEYISAGASFTTLAAKHGGSENSYTY